MGGGSLRAGANENTSGAVAALNLRSLGAILTLSILALSCFGVALGTIRADEGWERTSATKNEVSFGTAAGASRRAITAEGDCRVSAFLTGKGLVVSRAVSVSLVVSSPLRAIILCGCCSVVFGVLVFGVLFDCSGK